MFPVAEVVVDVSVRDDGLNEVLRPAEDEDVSDTVPVNPFTAVTVGMLVHHHACGYAAHVREPVGLMLKSPG